MLILLSEEDNFPKYKVTIPDTRFESENFVTYDYSDNTRKNTF